MLKNSKYIVVFLILIFAGCSNTKLTNFESRSETSTPKWIFDPTENGKYTHVAVGVADFSYYGPNAQRELAINRALTELAMQLNVKVVGETTIIDTVVNEKNSYTNKTQTKYIINNNVNGRVINSWNDNKDNRLYIRMISDKKDR